MAVNIFKLKFLNHKVNYSMVFMVAVYEYNISFTKKLRSILIDIYFADKDHSSIVFRLLNINSCSSSWKLQYRCRSRVGFKSQT